MNQSLPRFLVAGRLTRDYIILPSGDTMLDVPGGNSLYAAIGVTLWESDPPPALIARVGEDYPQEWLDDFAQLGLDIRGVRELLLPVRRQGQQDPD